MAMIVFHYMDRPQEIIRFCDSPSRSLVVPLKFRLIRSFDPEYFIKRVKSGHIVFKVVLMNNVFDQKIIEFFPLLIFEIKWIFILLKTFNDHLKCFFLAL